MSNRIVGGAIGAAFIICSVLAAGLIIQGILAGSGSNIILGIILGIPALIILYIADKRNTPKKDTVIETLKIRYAKGEITKEQFDEMKKRLDDLNK